MLSRWRSCQGAWTIAKKNWWGPMANSEGEGKSNDTKFGQQNAEVDETKGMIHCAVALER